MDKGQINSAKHADLLDSNQLYAEIYRSQLVEDATAQTTPKPWSLLVSLCKSQAAFSDQGGESDGTRNTGKVVQVANSVAGDASTGYPRPRPHGSSNAKESKAYDGRPWKDNTK